ncbi:MAG: extracellular solute-binding protein [Butyrivibrio sp.]|jgi:raffinose/stachyose/melibiose transport system substrate-binding protein|nr:extracellular solute-binding protein [Butyrivibrio sp.]
MKRNRKITAVVLTAAMAAGVCLSGCGSSQSGQSADTAQSTTDETDTTAENTTAEAADTSAKDGTVTIFQSKTEIMDQLNACAEDFTKETGIKAEVWETSGDSYYTDLKTDMSTNAGPTLFSLAPGAESKEMSDYLADLSALSFTDKIVKGMADTIDNRTVGIPYTMEGFGLVYDGALADPSTLTSTDALISYLQKEKAAGINGLGLSQEDYFLIMHILNTPFAIQSDPDAYLQDVLSGKVRMIDAPAFQEFAKLMEAIRANCTNPVDVTYDNNCGDFATGKTAIIHQGNWCYSMFKDYDVSFDMGLAPLPLEGNQKIAVSVPAAWYVNTDAPAADQAAAKQFLEWLYTSKTGTDYLMNQFGFIPVIDGMTSDQLDPISKSVAEAAASGNTIPWSLSNWPAGISTTLAPIAKEFFTSDMTGEELVNQLNDAFTAAK